MKLVCTVVFLIAISTNASEPELLSTQAQDAFFKQLSKMCGNAFKGKISVDTAGSKDFANKPLIMHVRECNKSQIKIPFHVGDDASRTWVLTKTGSGLSLKHDHRRKDGSNDTLTMYGGHTVGAGWPNVQSFPADAPTQEMFSEQGLPQSNTNIWQMFVYPESFSYRLIREGREFRVDFDLTQKVKTPVAPWGHK